MQDRCATKRDRWALGARAQQHRQHPEKHIVAQDHIGGKILQHLPQAHILGREQVDEESFHGNAQPFIARRNFCQFRREACDVSEVSIRVPRKCAKLRAGALDAISQPASGQHDQFVTLSHQHMADREQRIDMAGCRRRNH